MLALFLYTPEWVFLLCFGIYIGLAILKPNRKRSQRLARRAQFIALAAIAGFIIWGALSLVLR